MFFLLCNVLFFLRYYFTDLQHKFQAGDRLAKGHWVKCSPDKNSKVKKITEEKVLHL